MFHVQRTQKGSKDEPLVRSEEDIQLKTRNVDVQDVVICIANLDVQIAESG